MIFAETKLQGAFVLDLERREDNRGFFARSFCQHEFEQHGLKPLVAQVNIAEGLVLGCKLTRDVSQDGVLTYDDVELPPGRLADQLRAEQYRHFRGETWLEERIQGVEAAGAAPRG